MISGKLDRRVTLLRATAASNELNQPVESWAVLVVVWGGKQDLAGRKDVVAEQVNPEATTRFWLRWRSDISVADRISCDGENFDILHIGEVGRRDGLSILCRARPSV